MSATPNGSPNSSPGTSDPAFTPATDWRHRRLAPDVWLLCERGLGPTGRRKHHVSLPASASLKQLVKAAVDAVGREQPDVILMDVRMPGSTGFELCGALKQNAATRLIPISDAGLRRCTVMRHA